MADDKSELIRLLEAELDVIESGGYGSPAGQPGQEKPMFYHSLACINHWLVPGHEPECHDDCVLLPWVPEQHKSEALPCHFIPLNPSGDTVKSIEQKGSRERMEEEVKRWLRATIKKLKEEQASGLPEVKY
ncbi:MAG: hypothetical protein KIT09_21470 [Bryobacteraceae bacterium]|nr:hypothetical protein [Bryobacteraceae bacterium]